MTKSHLLLGTATLLALAMQALPQVPTPRTSAETGQGVITGQVVNASTGEPLAKVNLTLTPRGQGGSIRLGTSGRDGSFRFEVEAGTYALSGEHAGYIRGQYTSETTATIPVTANQTRNGVLLKLVPHGVIVGRVFDSDGDPVEGAEVAAKRYSYPRGRKQLVQVAAARTDDRGEYRLIGLEAGRYVVNASLEEAATGIQALFAGGRGGGRGGNIAQILGALTGATPANTNETVNSEIHLATYHPRATDPTEATALDVVAGAEFRGININLVKGRQLRVTGTVDGLPPAPVAPPAADRGKAKGKGFDLGQAQGNANGQGFNIANLIQQFAGQSRTQAYVGLVPRDASLAQDATQLIGGIGIVNAEGRFEITGAQPGSYYLVGRTGGLIDNQRLSAFATLDLAGRDAEGVRLRLSPPVEVSGVVTADQGAALDTKQFKLRLTPQVQQALGGLGGDQQEQMLTQLTERLGDRAAGITQALARINPNMEVNAEGKFQSKLDVVPYEVELQSTTGYYLKSVKVAGRELTDRILELTEAVQLEVVIANDTGSITGKVEELEGKPAPNARVTVVPADGSARRDLYRSAISAADGTFTVPNLPPGNYRVFAWQALADSAPEDKAWMDAEFRRPFEPLAAAAEIKDRQGPTLVLPLIRTGK